MSDAPERIWVDFEPNDWPSERIMYGDMPEPYAEYIRADLAAPDLAELVEALRGLLGLLDAGSLYEPQAYRARAALAKIKEPQR